jgi:hypothetical protein
METALPQEPQTGTGEKGGESFFVSAPSISLPKGGGAVRGIGEKFAANPVTGTGSLRVPLFVSPGRAGFQPDLSLTYDSGAGNGAFGLGWTLSLAAITRKTDKGNAIVYDYAEENSAGVDLSLSSERNRTHAGRAVNRCIKRINYGNRTSRLLAPDLSAAQWLFEVVFDYEEAHLESLPGDDAAPRRVKASASAAQPWAARPDPFSQFRPGFEVRTYRRCRRVMMFHHFDNSGRGRAGCEQPHSIMPISTWRATAGSTPSSSTARRPGSSSAPMRAAGRPMPPSARCPISTGKIRTLNLST